MAPTTASDAGTDDQNVKTTIAEALRENDVACAVIERTVNGEVVPTVYTAFEGEFARVKEASPVATKVKKFTLCQDIEDAQARGDNIEIRAEPQLSMDIEEPIARLIDDDKGTSETRTPTFTENEYSEVADKEPVGNIEGTLSEVAYDTGWD